LCWLECGAGRVWCGAVQGGAGQGAASQRWRHAMCTQHSTAPHSTAQRAHGTTQATQAAGLACLMSLASQHPPEGRLRLERWPPLGQQGLACNSTQQHARTGTHVRARGTGVSENTPPASVGSGSTRQRPPGQGLARRYVKQVVAPSLHFSCTSGGRGGGKGKEQHERHVWRGQAG